MFSEKFKISVSTLVALGLLFTMAVLMTLEAKKNTTIVDESPHILAGYSYLTRKDFRINPEHPPLIKMAAAIPLTFLDLNFIDESTAWKEGVAEDGGQWGQWSGGDEFLHKIGNDPRQITFWARVGPIIITLLLGLLLFLWTKQLFNSAMGLFTLTLFVFSPNFLAHGPLVTTDVGAAFAFLLATYFLFKYLDKQTKKNLLYAGIAFGVAQLMKFSLVLLLPFFTMVVIMWVFYKEKPINLFSLYTLKKIGIYLGKLIVIGVIGLIVAYPVYQYVTWNYPPEIQYRDTQRILSNSPFRIEREKGETGRMSLLEPESSIPGAVLWMSDKPILRPYAAFFLGHLMVYQRVAGGNNVYYFGKIANNAWKSYFPVVFAVKVPVALLIFIAISSLYLYRAVLRRLKFSLKGLGFLDKFKKIIKLKQEWISAYFVEFSFLTFILIYWGASILGNLNIGVRHVLPTFPFIYIIIASVMYKWVKKSINLEGETIFEKFKNILLSLFSQWFKTAVIVILLFWYIISPFMAYPHMLAYFNEIAGGSSRGHKIVVDSNLDWGQDLDGLVKFVEENNIEFIKLNYFGGGSPEYYLGDKQRGFDPRNASERNGWIAVSATFLQEGRARPVRNYPYSSGAYEWLNNYEPVEVIGHSIFVYNITE